MTNLLRLVRSLRIKSLNSWKLNLTRERTKDQITENLLSASVLLRNEAARYRKVLDTYDNLTLARILVVSRELREAIGENVWP